MSSRSSQSPALFEGMASNLDGEKAPHRHPCAWCGGPIPGEHRVDSKFCSKSHRQAAHRFGRAVAVAGDVAVGVGIGPARLAYADPPYPGLSRRYYQDHPDYAGEVDHRELVALLQGYDGWALSTSAEALPMVLQLLARVNGWRVASWHRGERAGRALGPRSAWEPVIYKPARAEVSVDQPPDAFGWHARARRADPHRVIGAKPASVVSWIFALMGARRGDVLADLFPGSGGVLAAWEAWHAPAHR